MVSPHSQFPSNRQWSPEDFPDLDFHQSFGLYLTRKNPISKTVNKDIANYWQILSNTPALLQHYIPDIEEKYRNAFRAFFTVDPISLHGHVSDASSPYLLTSLLLHLTENSPIRNLFLLSNRDREAPHVAVTKGYYGGGYGPLAHVSIVCDTPKLWSGPTPFVIDTLKPDKINDRIKIAKAKGCTVVIAEIVRSSDGGRITPDAWRRLLQACKRHTLVLVVDEAMTAVRCGAPFAHQLPEYRKYGLPDLILFGKGVKTNGIAIEWDGVNIRKLGITHPEARKYTITSWQERLTESAPPADLLSSWGTLLLAQTENWPQRARVIGKILRDFIEEEGIPSTSIDGLHSMIFVPKKAYGRILWPVMGANAGGYVRWLPTMDRVMTSKTELCSKVFGPDSLPHRKLISAYLRVNNLEPRWCSRCGGAVGAGVKIQCERCVANKCSTCEPGEHECPLDDYDNADSDDESEQESDEESE